MKQMFLLHVEIKEIEYHLRKSHKISVYIYF